MHWSQEMLFLYWVQPYGRGPTYYERLYGTTHQSTSHSTPTPLTKKDGLLKDKSFLVTGKLNNISRAEVKSLIEENSGTTVSSVSKSLNYLITGENPTKRKIESAKLLKIKIINQEEFLKILNKTS